jgi:hypothetical protein
MMHPVHTGRTPVIPKNETLLYFERMDRKTRIDNRIDWTVIGALTAAIVIGYIWLTIYEAL